jgi:hypothetical protein
MFLTKDYTGPASGQELGKRGDEVSIVPFTGWNDMVLVERNGKRAWLWPSDLSTEKPIECTNNLQSQVTEAKKKTAKRR